MQKKKPHILGLALLTLGLVFGFYQNCGSPGGAGALEIGSEEDEDDPTTSGGGGGSPCVVTVEFLDINNNPIHDSNPSQPGVQPLEFSPINAASIAACKTAFVNALTPCFNQTTCNVGGTMLNFGAPLYRWRAGLSTTTCNTPIFYNGQNIANFACTHNPPNQNPPPVPGCPHDLQPPTIRWNCIASPACT